MTTPPQVPPELEKKFDDEVYIPHDSWCSSQSNPFYKCDCDYLKNVESAKRFLAQALQDQREGFVKEVEMMELSGRGEEYRLAQDHIIDILKGKTK